MYDYICTDLPPACTGYRMLEQELSDQQIPLDRYPFEKEGVANGRVLVVSSHRETLSAARLRGYGTLEASNEDGVSPSLLRPLLTRWTDSPAGCRLFIFDIGDVVIRGIHILGKVAESESLPVDEFFDDYRRYDAPLMDGFIPTSAYWEHVRHKFGIQVDGDPFAREFNPTLNAEMLPVLERLRADRVRMVCGSNTFAPHWEIIEEIGALRYFDATYASHLMGVSKPSSLFYRHILEREGFSPEQTYFVDDNEDNIQSASAMGIRCLLYADGVAESAASKLQKAFGQVLHGSTYASHTPDKSGRYASDSQY